MVHLTRETFFSGSGGHRSKKVEGPLNVKNSTRTASTFKKPFFNLDQDRKVVKPVKTKTQTGDTTPTEKRIRQFFKDLGY